MPETITPEHAAFLRDFLLGTLKNESRTTKAVLESVPADQSSYRPDPNSRTAYELLRHIAVADNRFVESAINGVFDTTAAALPENVKTPQEIAAWYEQRYAKNFAALSKLSGENLAKVMDFRGLFQRPAVTFLVFGLTHAIHHRGQLAAYLRAMGAKVPAIYGESFDSAQAKKAAG